MIGKWSKEIFNLGLELIGFLLYIYFGKCEYILDVVLYVICNLFFIDGEEIMIFFLNESSGEDVYDSWGYVVGQVINFVWLINQFYYWKEFFMDYFFMFFGFNFDKIYQNIFFFNQDFLFVFDFYMYELLKIFYKIFFLVQFCLGMNFLDEVFCELYIYEVVDLYGDVMVVVLDFIIKEWCLVSFDYFC